MKQLWLKNWCLLLLTLLVIGMQQKVALALETYTFNTKWGTVGSANGQFRFPEGISTDSAGNIYVADSGNFRIAVYSATGTWIKNIATGWAPFGLAIDRSVQPNVMYVVDYTNDILRKLDLNGNLLLNIGSRGTGVGQFTNMRGVAVDNESWGYTYVFTVELGAPARVQRFNTDGSNATALVTSGLGTAYGIAVSSVSQALYVAEYRNYAATPVQGNLHKFDFNGLVWAEFGAYGITNSGMFSIATDRAGNVYVGDTDAANQRIRKFDSSDSLITSWGGPAGSGDGQFNTPFGITVAASGDVFVSDYNNARVQKFSPSPKALETRGVAATGQTVSYAAGDDGAQQKGVPWPSPRFTNNIDGTMTDNLTGLMWTQSANAPGPAACSPGVQKNWADAFTYINCLNTNNYLNYDDWRLPNVIEFQSLINFSVTNSNAWLTAQGFGSLQSAKYFSSTPIYTGDGMQFVISADFINQTLGLYYDYAPYVHPIWPVRTAHHKAPAPLPISGITFCMENGRKISSCNGIPEYPQDGASQLGVPWPGTRIINEYPLTGNRSFFDAATGLNWIADVCTPGPAACSSSGNGQTWQGALDHIVCLNTNNYLGFNDWRLPNINELSSLIVYGVDYGHSASWFLNNYGVIVNEGIPWSSTSKDATYAYGVNIFRSTINTLAKVAASCVFPVRGGKSGTGLTINQGASQTGKMGLILAINAAAATGVSSMQFTNDNGTNWSTPEPFATRKVWTLNNDWDAGNKTVGVRLFDTTTPTPNNSILWGTIAADFTPPDDPVVMPLGGIFQNVTVDFAASSEPSVMYYTTDGTNPTYASPAVRLPFTLPITATTTVKYVASDAVGNWPPGSYPPTQIYTVDTTAPANGRLTIAGPMTNGFGNQRSVNLVSIGADDPNGISLMRINDSNSNWGSVVAQAYAATATYTITSPGDGQKTVWASFNDVAGNWSTSGFPSGNTITIDQTPPVVTISPSPYPAIGWYNTPQTVNFSCNDIDGIGCLNCASGCKDIYYTTNGTSPTLASSHFNAASGSLLVSSNTSLRYMGVDSVGNQSSSPTQQFMFETVLPTVSIGAPLNGDRLATLAAVSGSAADSGGSGLARVEIQITDGTNYVKADQSFGPAATWISLTPNGSGNWSFATNLVPWTAPKTYTVTARAFDKAGNISTPTSRNFTIWTYAKSTTTFVLASRSIKNADKASLSGILNRDPEDPLYDLSGLPISIKVTDPPGYNIPPLATTYTTTTTDSAGHFQLLNFSDQAGRSSNAGFGKKGAYTIEVSFSATSVLGGGTSSQNLMVGSSAGYAILVEGKLKDDPGKTTTAPYHNLAHAKTTQRIYETLLDRKLNDFDIYYFNYDPASTGVDAVPDKAEILRLLTETGATYGSGPFATQSTIAAKIKANPGPLYLIFVDHGDPGNFHIDTDATTVAITPTDLNDSLNTLEIALSAFPQASAEKRFIINGSCYSGSFIPTLSKSGRVVIASAANTEQSFMGALEDSDGIRSGEFFLEEFFGRLRVGDTFKSSFDYASDKVRIYTRYSSSNAPIPPFSDNAIQHPVLDDDGDGKGSYTLVETDGDGVVTKDLYLGFANDTTNAGNPAEITSLSQTQFLSATQNSATLSLTTANYADTLAAWVEIRKPATVLTGNGQNRQLDPSSFNITKVLLGSYDPTPTAGDEIWVTNYTGFTDSGKYEIFHYAQEANMVTTGRISAMKRSLVYKNKAGNSPPVVPTLLLPVDIPAPYTGMPITKRSILFDWSDAADADADPITYTLEIFDYTGALKYRKEEITTSRQAIVIGTGPGQVNLPDTPIADPQKYYSWRVKAIDTYGGTGTSSMFHFRLFNLGDDNTYQFAGIVSDAATGAVIVGASVTGNAGGSDTTVAPDGSYFIQTLGTTTSIIASAAGYAPKTVTVAGTLSAIVPKNIQLTSTATGPVKINSSYYADPASAYTAAASGATIQMQNNSFAGPFTFGLAKAVTLSGGYDTTFARTSSFTTLQSSVTIAGDASTSVVFDQIVIQ